MKLSGVFAALIACVLPTGARSQLVADGQTNVLNGVYTYSPGSLTVGTNGAFTLLIITNGATVLNTGGNAVIGSNASAETNRVVVTGAGSSWQSDNGFYIGQSGSTSELDILNGGNITDISGAIGDTTASSNNLVLVSGIGSTWTNTGGLTVGNTSTGNTLIVTNGGKVFSGVSSVGKYALTFPGAGNNFAVITGLGSSWSSGYFNLGNMDFGHDQLLINNGGTFVTSSTLDIGEYCNSNGLNVADAGSSLQCQTFRIGYSSTANQCIVSNGATLAVSLSSQPATIEGTFTVATVTGAGSLWTNAGDLDFGQYSNVLYITSGGTMVDNNGYIETGSGKPNSAIVAGTNSLWKNLGDLHIADIGGQLLITNGGMVANNYGYLGDNAGNNNCFVLVSGVGSVWTNRDDLYVGNNGASNQLLVTGSGKAAADNVYVGFNGTSNLLVVANSGTLVARGNFYMGYESGNRNQMVVSNSGMVTIANQLQISSGTSSSNTVTVNGGTVIVTNGVTLESYGTIVVNSGFFKANSLFTDSDTSRVNFNGGMIQSGSTSYYFSPGNAVPFVVGDGTDAATFQMLNSGLHSFSGGLIVSSNATLTGAGTLIGNVSIGNGGTFALGSTNFWTLNMNSGLVLSNGSTNVMGLNVHYDEIYIVNGATNVVYGGTLQLTNLASPTPYASGQTYNLFYASNYSGAFSKLVPATPGPGLRWDTNELNVDGVLRIFPTNSQPPVLGSNEAIASGNLILSASSGIPYDPVYLLTSTNLATPEVNWTCCSTNYFDTTGAVSITNAIVSGEPQRYFRLQVQ